MYKSSYKRYREVQDKDEWFKMFKVLLFILLVHLIYFFSCYLNFHFQYDYLTFYFNVIQHCRENVRGIRWKKKILKRFSIPDAPKECLICCGELGRIMSLTANVPPG